MLTFTIAGQPADLTASALAVPAGAEVRVDLASGGHWYGHGFSHVQPYPLETGRVVNPRFAVNNIQCPIWMCSAGYVLFADTTTLLDVRLNADGDGWLVLRADEPFTLRLFRGATLPDAQRALLAALGWPAPTPPLGDSLFCTWTQYPRTLTQARVLDFARQIRARGYPASTLIIDDRWESAFGELTFSADFPDPTALLRDLRALAFDTWLWVTPFVNEEAATFADLERRHVLVPAKDGSGAARFAWWGGTAGLVDVTHPDGRAWFTERLRALQALGVAGFKVDGGDFKYQPDPAGAAWHAWQGHSGYSDALLATVEAVAPLRCETRTAWLSQGRRVLWREGGKDSHWGLDNGLQAMITLALHLGLMGYDITMPDMIPGRVQTLVSDFPLPTDELMVRWTEATACFPLMQFSYAPWNYAPATEAVVRAYAQMHKALEPYLTAEAAERTGPLLRPLWYDAPAEASLYPVADAWLLGRDLLAAPVVVPGATTRDIPLPPGAWIDAWTGATVSGTLTDYPAPCPGLPLFVRAGRDDLLAQLQPALAAIPRGTVPTGVTTTTYRAGLDREISVTG
jgi:alpha-glucosidase (family GH31 glycosyl hydrolase)